MEDIKILEEKFLKVQKLFDSKKKNKITLATEMLDGMYREYSAINWIEDGVSTKAEDEKLQMLHYVYKETYAFQLIDHYNLFLLVISNEIGESDEPSKYKAFLDGVFSHLENILAELEELEKVTPSETLHERLRLNRRQCNNFYSHAIEMMKHQEFILNMPLLTQENHD